MKKYLKKLNANKAKTFVLAGLMGLTPSCKMMDKNEPDAPQSTNNSYVVPNVLSTNQDVPVDSFMTHMPNVEGVKFYKPRDYNGHISLETNYADGRVSYLTDHDVERRWGYALPKRYARKDAFSVNNTAHFDFGETTYYFEINDPQYGYELWSMGYVPESQYQNMTPDQLAEIAQNHGCDAYVCNLIRNGQGTWNIWNESTTISDIAMESQGYKARLQYSDIGVYDWEVPVASGVIEGWTEPYYHFSRVYAGGLESKKANKPTTETYKGLAVAQIEETDGINRKIVYTNPGAARMTVDAAQNETIVMPFNNWYHVTVIKTNGHVAITLADSLNAVNSTWQVQNPQITDFDVSAGIQENGLAVVHSQNFEEPFKGSRGVEFEENDRNNENIGVRISVATDFYGDTPYEPSEVVVQGYRTDRNFVSTNTVNGLFFGFAFGGTNRPDENTGDITTGLENVYCAPGRQR